MSYYTVRRKIEIALWVVSAALAGSTLCGYLLGQKTDWFDFTLALAWIGLFAAAFVVEYREERDGPHGAHHTRKADR